MISLLLASAIGVPLADDRPNILLLISDDQGYGDLSCYGGDISTPNIDSIARDGALFTDFYVTAPVCTPSRYSMLTGRYPWRAEQGLGSVGMILNKAHLSHGLTKNEPTIADSLQSAGYETALFGKWHLGHGDPAQFPTAHGFNEFYGATGGCIDYFRHTYGFLPDWFRGTTPLVEEGYTTDLITDEAVAFLSRERSAPFFLVLSHFAPHYGKSHTEDGQPSITTLRTRSAGEHKDDGGATFHLQNTLQVPARLVEQFADEPDEKRRYFKAMVRSLDDSIGRVLKTIDKEGLRENTVVIFRADNGPDETVSSSGDSGPLAGAKHSLLEGGIRVPALIRWPSRVSPGSTITQLSSALDLFPTLASIGLADTPVGLDGFDMSVAWTKGTTFDRTLVWRQGDQTAVRRARWKLLGDRLFDLKSDIGETTDVSNDHPTVVRNLKLLGR